MLNSTENFGIAIFSPSLAMGGAERTVINLAQAFMEHGHSVQLILAHAKGELLADLPSGVITHNLGQDRVSRVLPALMRILRAERPAILLSMQTHANLIALLAIKLAGVSTKVVVCEHSTISKNTSFSSRKDIYLKILARVFYPAANAIVAVSKGVSEDLARTIGIQFEKIKVIYNPIVNSSLLDMACQDPHHPWTESGSPPLVLAVGRLTAAKDYPTLIRAFFRVRQQREMHLLILGEGEKRLELESLVKTLGLENDVQLPGQVHNPYSYLARASVFVLSSAWEGLPNVLIEALACGAPVISTDCKSGPSEILEDGRYGILIPVGNADELSVQILNVINSRPDKKMLQTRGKSFSVERATQEYIDLFSSLLS